MHLPNVRATIVLDEEADADLVNRVLSVGYGENLADSELEKIWSISLPDRLCPRRD